MSFKLPTIKSKMTSKFHVKKEKLTVVIPSQQTLGLDAGPEAPLSHSVDQG